jgi:hypothetical protein
MQNLSMSLLKIPKSQLMKIDERIDRVNINFRKKKKKPRSNIELIFIIDEVFSVHEVFPLRLRFVSRSGVVMNEFRMGILNVLLFPLFVFTVTFEFSDERVERDRLMVGMRIGMGIGRGKNGEVGTEFETAVTVRRVVVGGGVERRVRRKEKENKKC